MDFFSSANRKDTFGVLRALLVLMVSATALVTLPLAAVAEESEPRTRLSEEWYGTWQRADGKETLEISPSTIEVVVVDDLSGQIPAPRRWEYKWTTANPADGTRPYTFGYADTSLSTEQLKRQLVKALARQDPVFSVSAPVQAQRILEALSLGMHERLWAYGEGDFDIGYVLAGDTIVEVQDTMYTFALAGFRRVSADIAAARPAASDPDSSASDSRVEVVDGSVLAGEIQGGKAAFKSAFGEINVSLEDVKSFSEGELRLADGTVLKGNFLGGKISVRTSLGTLEVAAKDVRAIERLKAPVSKEETVLGAGQGLLSGRVIDNFGVPVAGATVHISGTTFRATTQGDGSYEIPYVPGTITVEIAREGYDPTSFSLNLAQASQYPVEQKRLLRLPERPGVFYWDKSGWQALEECTSEEVPWRGPAHAAKEERYRIAGEALTVPEHPWSPLPSGEIVLLDNTPTRGNLRIYRVDGKSEIITKVVRRYEHFGVEEMGAMLEPGRSAEGTSSEKFQKLQLYPRRVFYAAKFSPGSYAVVDPSYERLCFRFQIGDAPPAQSKAGEESTGSVQALQVEGKTVRYEPSSTAPNQAIFNFVSDGYRNTYALDCGRRQFRWIENVRVSTGRVTGNSDGSDWRPMNPRSTISNAVYDAVCPGLLSDGVPIEKSKGAEVTGEVAAVPANPSFDCGKASTWSERAVCNDQAIALLDTKVAALYSAARESVSDAQRDAIKREQLAWLKKREACSHEAQSMQCLRRAYDLRIEQLRAIAGTGM